MHCTSMNVEWAYLIYRRYLLWSYCLQHHALSPYNILYVLLYSVDGRFFGFYGKGWGTSQIVEYGFAQLRYIILASICICMYIIYIVV